jgi:hypothetical protein
MIESGAKAQASSLRYLLPNPSGCFGSSALLDQASDRWGCLRAHAEPVRQAVLRNAQAFFAALGDGVVKPDALNKTAIAANAFVSHNDVEKRAMLGTAARESNDDHDLSLGGGAIDDLENSRLENRAKMFPAALETHDMATRPAKCCKAADYSLRSSRSSA